jgi:hypothetical protein
MTSSAHFIKATVIATPVRVDRNEYVVIRSQGEHGHSMQMTVGAPRLSDSAIFCLLHNDYITFLRELGAHSGNDFFFHCHPTPRNRMGFLSKGKTTITLFVDHKVEVSYCIDSSELKYMF